MCLAPATLQPLRYSGGSGLNSGSGIRCRHVQGSVHRPASSSRLFRRRKRERRPRLCFRADLYSILHLSEHATKAEVKVAYRRLARQLHPDTNHSPEAVTHFQAVTDAYNVLSSDHLRSRYDQLGYASLRPEYAKYAAYGGKFRQREAESGKDVMAVVWLDLVEAALGAERVVQVKVACACPACLGAPSMAACSGCQLCRGSGEVIRGQAPHHGELAVMGACPSCGGGGTIVRQWCRKCGGRGLARSMRKLRVRIPPGVDSNSVLRLKGRGDAGRFGGVSGDAYVSFVIRERPDITRRGIDMHSQVTVAYTDAILGTSRPVNTIRGPANLTIPPGTQHGDIILLEGAGISQAAAPINTDVKSLPLRAEAPCGVHYFEVVVRLPLEIGPHERKLLEQLRS